MSGSEGRFPKSLIEFQGRFASESACADYLFERRWAGGFVCPGCGDGRAWLLKTKEFTYECAACGRQTSVTAGTIMHASKLSLTKWFWAAFLMATHSNGISALQLQSQLGLGSYRTAWMLCAKLRRAMVNPEREPLCGVVEADETIIPFRRAKAGCATSTGSRRTRLAPPGMVPALSLEKELFDIARQPDVAAPCVSLPTAPLVPAWTPRKTAASRPSPTSLAAVGGRQV